MASTTKRGGVRPARRLPVSKRFAEQMPVAAIMTRWSVDIIRGRKAEHLGTVEANSQREAYSAAIEKFTVPIERQNRLFVAKIKND